MSESFEETPQHEPQCLDTHHEACNHHEQSQLPSHEAVNSHCKCIQVPGMMYPTF